jgi:hypothetical protein
VVAGDRHEEDSGDRAAQCGADKALYTAQRGLLQAGLHSDQSGDRHPVGARQVQPEGDGDRARHGDGPDDPGPHQDPRSANDQHDADDEEKHAGARQSVAIEGSPEVPGMPTVKAESPDSDDDERDPGGTHEHGSEYQLAQTPVGHIVGPWLVFTRRLGHDYHPHFLPACCSARARIGLINSVR